MKRIVLVFALVCMLITGYAQTIKTYQVQLQTKGGVRSSVTIQTSSMHNARVIIKKMYPNFILISIKNVK
jgi:hypothetical protein